MNKWVNRSKNKGRSAMFVGGILMATTLFAAKTVEIGQVNNLNVSAAFKNFAELSSTGDPIYHLDQPVLYQIQVRHKGGPSYSEITIQSSLHTDGVSCETYELYPGRRMPGPAFSPEHRTPLSSGRLYEFDIIYTAPPDFCASTGHLKVRIKYTQSGRRHATTVISPVHFELQ